MGKINLLDIETTNKIAAGEVIERPFSVVKELVENSIDAKAKNITIEIEEGGQKLIKIIDNGTGIEKEDIKKAFMPHATSKISSIEDVYAINTMGFRGEALASISAVSKVKLKTRVKDSIIGKELYIEGGKIDYIQDTGCNVGTYIEVKDLFYNIPARLKFLKSPKGDATAIGDIINRFILCNKDIAFTLINNGKETVKSYGSCKLEDAIRVVYGKKVSENIIHFNHSTDIVTVHGVIGNVDISRRSRSNQSIFVNNRYIKSRFITTAIENAFKSFLTVNNYPFFIIFIDIFPEYIDVNVHPTKSEVKFKDEGFIFKLIFDTVHSALKENIKSSMEGLFENTKESFIDAKNNNTTCENSENTSFFDKTINHSKQSINLPVDLTKNIDIKENITNKSPILGNTIVTKESNLKSDVINKNVDFFKDDFIKQDKKVVKVEENNLNNVLDFKIIGQFNKTYILIEKQEELFIIDQHAAHERVLFEKFKEQVENDSVVSQILITPVILELSQEEFDIYTHNKDIFKNAGFLVSLFGENTISIREVPMILGKPNLEKLFIDILFSLKEFKTYETPKTKYDQIAKLSCKSAVKAKNNLNDLEIKALIKDMMNLDNPFACPHGRPTVIKFTLGQLEKKFKRTQ